MVEFRYGNKKKKKKQDKSPYCVYSRSFADGGSNGCIFLLYAEEAQYDKPILPGE